MLPCTSKLLVCSQSVCFSCPRSINCSPPLSSLVCSVSSSRCCKPCSFSSSRSRIFLSFNFVNDLATSASRSTKSIGRPYSQTCGNQQHIDRTTLRIDSALKFARSSFMNSAQPNFPLTSLNLYPLLPVPKLFSYLFTLPKNPSMHPLH